MKLPDLRTWEPSASDAVNVEDTKMLDVNARETPETVDAVNKTVEYVPVSPSMPSLGATGRK